MTSPDDPSFWEKAATWIAAGAATLIAMVWGDMKIKVSRLEEQMDTKVDKEEMDKQRENVNTLFEGQTIIRQEIQKQGEKLTETLHGIHVDLLDRIEERKLRK